MARGRRKLQAVLSDDEAAAPPTPRQQRLEVTDAHCEVDSDVDVPLPSSKKPRLEETTAIGKRTNTHVLIPVTHLAFGHLFVTA